MLEHRSATWLVEYRTSMASQSEHSWCIVTWCTIERDLMESVVFIEVSAFQGLKSCASIELLLG